MARAFGEFGAVSVVSGHVDVNDTMPLRIEKLWNEYNNQAAFTVASVLALLAVFTLIAKSAIEWKAARDPADEGAAAMTIEVKNISKSYGAVPVLRNIDLKINSGELIALLARRARARRRCCA